MSDYSNIPQMRTLMTDDSCRKIEQPSKHQHLVHLKCHHLMLIRQWTKRAGYGYIGKDKKESKRMTEKYKEEIIEMNTNT
ncbi:hypothetical protein CHS0354_033885 [Potamilus streckersoni]|uniref:Uncharacterized protein n=1 Tax=Potamilus streckersoni TaxID=2493646 RepID=A0AAE0RWV4_9BIVA|nr:hypothetical protein CHS0354_033885 [Potamilus streckersoni]